MDFSFLLIMGLMLVLAKIFGEVTLRLGFVSLVGEVIAGVVVVLMGIQATPFLTEFLMIGFILLMFIAGLGVRVEELKNNIYSASTIAICGGVVSFLLGLAVGVFFLNNFLIGIALGAILAATSDTVVFGFLMKMREFKTSVGKMIVSVNIADDVVGVMILSLFTYYVSKGIVEVNNLLIIFFITVGFYFIFTTVGRRGLIRMMKSTGKFKDEEVFLSFAVAIAIAVAIIAENVGVGLASGAFVAGMALANSNYSESVMLPKLRILADSFFLPLFFTSIGAMMVIKDINYLLTALIFAAAVAGKLLGCGMSSYLFKFRSGEARFIGTAMIARGDTNIIITQIALTLGIITAQIFTSTILAIILTIILTPVFLRFLSTDKDYKYSK